MKSPKDAVLKESDEFVKYALVDQGSELRYARHYVFAVITLLLFTVAHVHIRGKNITLKLMWDHMPLTGRLYVDNQGSKSFSLPSEYT